MAVLIGLLVDLELVNHLAWLHGELLGLVNSLGFRYEILADTRMLIVSLFEFGNLRLLSLSLVLIDISRDFIVHDIGHSTGHFW